MPWKKTFEVEDAVEAAMMVFWAKGYEATSIADLTEATGVQRQSLYNAIGNKQQIFVRSLLRYDTERRQRRLAELEARGTPLASIRAFFAWIVQQSGEASGRRGCLLVNTALAIQGHDDEVKLLVSSAVDDLRRFFQRTIAHGKVIGEISESVDADATASGLLAALMGIRVMARGSTSDEVLRQAGEQALRLVTSV